MSKFNNTTKNASNLSTQNTKIQMTNTNMMTPNINNYKKFLLMPLCVAISSYVLVGCSSTPSSTQSSRPSTMPQGANQPINHYPPVNNYPSSSTSDVGSVAVSPPPLSTQTPAIQNAAVPLLDEEDIEELANLLEATDMTMVEDNQLAIRQYGNLWDRLRAGYALDQSQYTYNSRIEAQKNWFIPRQDYLNRLSARASRYLYHTVQEAERRNIPTELALLPVIESSYDPTATSNASAAGLWQFIPSTGRIYGLNQSSTYDGRRDVIESTRAAYDFLTTLYNQFGSWELALAAYNAGPGRIHSAIDYNESRGLPTDFWSLSLPKETMSYVPRFLAVAQIVKNPNQYGVTFPAIANRQHFRSVPVNHGVTLDEISRITGVSYEELRMLNPALIAGKVDVSGPNRIVIPNEVNLSVDARLSALPGDGVYNVAVAPFDYNNNPYANGELSSSSDGLAEFVSNARVPSQTTTYIEPSHNEPSVNPQELERINAELIQSNRLPTTSATVTPNATIIQEPPLSQEERDSIAYQIREQAPQVQEVVSPVDGNIRLNAVQTQQSILASQGEEKRLSFDSASTTAPNNRPSGTRSVYVVQRGDTLSNIGARAGVNWRDIARWNQIDPNATLLAGSTLYLYNARPITSSPSNTPSSSSQYYIVQSGDTLIGTANRFGLTVSQLASYNNLSTNSELRTDQKLWLIPGKVTSSSTSSAPATTANYNGRTQTYRVRSGDTLTGLATRYNISINTLAGMNNISTREQLIIGQRLTVPANANQNNSSPDTSSNYNGPVSNYTVQSGDSLVKLSNALGVSRQDIAALNSFDANSQLLRGQVIKLPASAEKVSLAVKHESITYKVQSGDTLIGLANRYGVSVSQLAAANNLSTTSQLIRDNNLTIPASGSLSSSSSSTTTPNTSSQTTSYKVQSGDTLIGLANRFGISVSQLAAANDLTTTSQLIRGRNITIPAGGSVSLNTSSNSTSSSSPLSQTTTYRVKSGDTLIGLANHYGVSVSDLAATNNIATNAQLRIGQTLKVPSNTSGSNTSGSSATNSQSSLFDITDNYTVKSGDTLIGVASRYGVSANELASANNLANNAHLRIGQTIKVPKLTIQYTVKSGDTLIGLARRYGVSTQDISTLNNISSTAELRIGQTLTIPRR